MSAKRLVEKIFCSRVRRSSELARRKVANEPWGSRTTWQNCWGVSPIRSTMSWLVSSMRLDRCIHSPSTSSCAVTDAFSGVRPAPRFFGRSHFGDRVSLKRRPRTVNSTTTCGAASGAAWSLRRWPAPLRAPGTSPYRPKHSASSTVVLPAPVSPCRRNRCWAARVSTSMTCLSTNAPKASISSRCTRIRRSPRRQAPQRSRMRTHRRARRRPTRSTPRRHAAAAAPPARRRRCHGPRSGSRA